MVPNQPQPALLFMPDISGFTQFVNDTEIMHSQQIIQELLEVLIESNQLDLKVGEIEGDAIFFYKLGSKPDIQALLKQVEKMFTSFHQHLKLYDQQRICPCKACESAVQLSLKIVTHFGEVTGISVREHNKLFGKDVILIHRLLKNKLDKKEYILLTDKVIETGDQERTGLPEWYIPQSAVEQYDLGEVQFYFSDLCNLHSSIPKVTSPKYRAASKTYVAFSVEDVISAPIENVFEMIFDIPQRPKWLEGVKGIEMITHDHIHRVGTRHRCIVSEKNNPVMITESVKIGAEDIELVEMDEKGMGGCRYNLQKISAEQTKLSIHMLVKNNPLMKLFFSLAMKSKMMKQIRRSFENLKKHFKQAEPQLVM